MWSNDNLLGHIQDINTFISKHFGIQVAHSIELNYFLKVRIEQAGNFLIVKKALLQNVKIPLFFLNKKF